MNLLLKFLSLFFTIEPDDSVCPKCNGYGEIEVIFGKHSAMMKCDCQDSKTYNS
ncbi:MAG: hypothetical protein WC979_03180 [Candidatus Pacearchaeota archaeon]|jgi:hypothetical protein|nr:hypothetical protein [Clostridia bacterium]